MYLCGKYDAISDVKSVSWAIEEGKRDTCHRRVGWVIIGFFSAFPPGQISIIDVVVAHQFRWKCLFRACAELVFAGQGLSLASTSLAVMNLSPPFHAIPLQLLLFWQLSTSDAEKAVNDAVLRSTEALYSYQVASITAQRDKVNNLLPPQLRFNFGL